MESDKTPKSANKSKTDDYWRTVIETAELNDDEFNLKVVMLEAAGHDQDFLYLSKFEIFAQEEKRSVIKNITKTETIFMVNKLGVEKKERTDGLRVFEEAHESLKVNKNCLPNFLSALIIKQQMLNMKKRYLNIKKQRQQLKEGMKIESTTMIDRSEVKGTITKPLEKLENQIKKDKNEMGLEISVTKEGKKYNTLLREHGEEWRDKVYVDDFPVDGPHLYVVISGFSNPFLPRELVKIGIPLVAIVQVRVDPLLKKIPSSLIQSSKRGQSKTELLAEQASQFWVEIQNERIKSDVADVYKDIAFISFKPPYNRNDELRCNPENIYDELSFLLYDIQDLSRQHGNYLDNIEIIHIKREKDFEQYFDNYTNIIDRLPNECTTIFHVLDSILKAIIHNNKDKDNSVFLKNVNASSDFPKGTDDKVHLMENSQNFVKKIFTSLQTLHEDDYDRFKTEQDIEYSLANPLILNFGDYASLMTFNLPVELNMHDITNTMLINMPLNKLWNYVTKPFGEHEAKINYHLNVLIKAFDRKDVEICELHRLLQVMGLKKLYYNRSSMGKSETIQKPLLDFTKHYLKRCDLSEPLHKINAYHFKSSGYITSSNHPIYDISPILNSEKETKDISPISSAVLFECPDISGLISDAELMSKKTIKNIIEDYEYFEDFDLNCSLQVLHTAFTEFDCVNYKYCKLSDSILILLYNRHDEDGIFTKEWKADLRTPLCMQDFFDYILEDHYDWLQSEEKAYDCMIEEKYKKERLDDLESTTNGSCLEQSFLDSEMIIEGSLKHDALMKSENISLDSANSSSPVKNKIIPLYTSTDITNIHKTGLRMQVTRSNRSISENSCLITEKKIIKKFIGYDLGDRRIQMFGRDASFFSLDGTNIICKYFMLFPSKQEYFTINFISGNKKNALYIHKNLELYTNLTIATSLRIMTKNEVQIYWQKQSFEIILPLIQSRYGSEPLVKHESPIRTDASPVPVTEFYFSLVISCPNGLLVESVHEANSNGVSHIKQTFLKNCTSKFDVYQEKRCITNSGQVIIFKQSGNIEILFPDSSYILCTKYIKKLLEIDSIKKEIPKVTTDLSDRKKDTKAKNIKETKERSKKEMRKSREYDKGPLIFEQAVEQRYELVFLEYLVIESDGRKKQFIDNHFEEKEVLLIQTATDYCLGEVFSRRMDGTNILYSNDGMLTVTFANGTRIISSYFIEENDVFPEWTEEEYAAEILSNITMHQSANTMDYSEINVSFNEIIRKEGYSSIYLVYIIEHENYATVTVNTSNREFTVDMPNSVSVTINGKSHYKITLDNRTTATMSSDNFHIDYDACENCCSKTSCDIDIRDLPKAENNLRRSKWLWLKDSYGKLVSIDYEGVLKVHEDNLLEHELLKEDSKKLELSRLVGCTPTKELSHSSICKDVHLSKQYRFFVLHRDLTATELVHKLLVKEYKSNCLLQPWSSVGEYDVFGDNRKLLSTLCPIDRNESEKWLMDSKFACRPQNLVYKDLRADEGKGFYEWMRPYERFQPEPRKPAPAVAPGLPRALVLRTLEHLWKEDDPELLKGDRELFAAIIKYRKIMDEDKETMTADPVHDPRSRDEVDQYQRVQNLAQRTIEKLLQKMKKYKIDHGGDSNQLKTIKIPQKGERLASLQGDGLSDEISRSSVQTSVDEKTLQELEEVVPMRPELARYWKVRAEENKQEQFFKEVLRQGTVPPYFENIFGGAIWWEMNNTAGDAVTTSEDDKGSCCCCQHNPEVSCESVGQQDRVNNDYDTSFSYDGNQK